MKVIKPFFLGTLGGLALSVVLLVGLYFSPLRETVYFLVDPEMADVRGKLSQYREWLSQADLYIAEKGPETSDSLQTAQSLAWREYKKWRTHLGTLAHAHTKPTAEGFWTWTFSLRYWVIPAFGILALLPSVWIGWRMRTRYRPGRRSLTVKPGRAKGAGSKAQNAAINSFEEAVKKIAKISDEERRVHPEALAHPEFEPPTTEMIPDTKPLPILTESGLETNYPQTGTVWGETQPATLSMEDEDGDKEEDGKAELMPPTTEVELVERRNGEVLKLARKGLTSSEISRRLRISQDQVEFIIRLRREKG